MRWIEWVWVRGGCRIWEKEVGCGKGGIDIGFGGLEWVIGRSLFFFSVRMVAVTMERIGSEEDEGRSCVDCGTTKTPMWRSGPRGSKSLCNACGIRWKKANAVVSRRHIQSKSRVDHRQTKKASVRRSIEKSKGIEKQKKKKQKQKQILRLEEDAATQSLMEVIDFYHYKPLFSGLMVVNKKRGF